MKVEQEKFKIEDIETHQTWYNALSEEIQCMYDRGKSETY
jgi:hypothetical protein